jgi:uncharacterized protein involved in exopolysaccharide biosynthesis
MDNSVTTVSGRDNLSLRNVGNVLFAGRFWVIGFTIVTTLACSLFAFLSTPIYRSSAVLAPVEANQSKGGLSSVLGQFGGLASLAGINIDTRDSRIEEVLAVLRSREFIGKFISDHNLLPILFPEKWDPHSERWAVSEAKVPTPWRGYKYFREKVLNIERDKKSGLITVSIDWKDRDKAAAWTNEIVERANTEMRVRALDEAVAATRYLEKEREQTQLVETRAAINHLIESEIDKKMLATVTKEYVFRVVDRALPADVTDILKPKKLLLVILGVVSGMIAGSIVVLLRFGSYRARLGTPATH